VEELLPNRLIGASDGRFESVSRAVVIGEPTAVRPGVADDWSAMDGDDESSARVEFSDPEAEARTWLVTVAVEEVLGGEDPVDDGSPGEMTVRLTAWGDLAESEAFATQVEALGRSVWFLGGGDDEGVRWVPWDGGAVAAVGEDGSLSFPLLPEARGAGSWAETYRLDCLRSLAAQPDQQVPFVR
jgi:hypothetical protein